ncbi:MAG TPA: response regulator, partial [Negativicutes bacterium]|nr:response regulator [Negativicutes bacterium]
MGKRILFVDDEKPILRAIDRLFFDSGYEVLTAENAEAGLAVLAEGPVDVVVSDIRMPGMDGHEFLRKVKILYPEATRLILSGYADENAILNSIMDGSSNMYMLKPWDGQDIKKKVAQIFAARELFNNKALLDFANRLDNLSSVPGVYNDVVRLTEQGADVAQIAAVIETD